MRNEEHWRPTKFVQAARGLRVSRDPSEVAISSRLVGDIQAVAYERLIREHARGVLLDLGCGDVPLYGVYRDLVSEVVCVDWEESQHDASHLDRTVDLNEPLPFSDAAFDTVLTTDVIEHVRRPDQLWRELARILRPGGRLILTVPFLYWIHEEPHDHFRYTEYRLRAWCEENDLDLVHFERAGGAPEVVLDTCGKVFEAVASRLRLRVLLPLVHHLSRACLALPPVRALSRRTEATFPLGYRLVASPRSR